MSLESFSFFFFGLVLFSPPVIFNSLYELWILISIHHASIEIESDRKRRYSCDFPCSLLPLVLLLFSFQMKCCCCCCCFFGFWEKFKNIFIEKKKSNILKGQNFVVCNIIHILMVNQHSIQWTDFIFHFWKNHSFFSLSLSLSHLFIFEMLEVWFTNLFSIHANSFISNCSFSIGLVPRKKIFVAAMCRSKLTCVESPSNA